MASKYKYMIALIITVSSFLFIMSLKEDKCGIITQIYEQQLVNSGGKRSRVYIKKEIDVNFGTSQEVINVDSRTYFNAKIGKQVCFSFYKINRDMGFFTLMLTLMAISFILAVMIIVQYAKEDLNNI